MIHFYLAKNYTVLKRFDWVHFMQSYEKIVNKDCRVLEIGGSERKRTKKLSKYCKELIMVEKFPERMPHFSPRSNIRVITGDWQNLSSVIESESVDIICASHVIEHAKNDLKCLNESYQVLKKGGYLLFNTPNRKRLIRAIIELFKGEKKFPWWEHEREYVKRDLEELIHNSRFNNSYCKIKGVSLGVNGGPLVVYLDKFPLFLEKYSSFWEVIIKKNYRRC